MYYYGSVFKICFSENHDRELSIHSDYAFTKDRRTGHWVFIKYRYSKEGFNTEFLSSEHLLDYVYKDLKLVYEHFDRSKMNQLTKFPSFGFDEDIADKDEKRQKFFEECREIHEFLIKRNVCFGKN